MLKRKNILPPKLSSEHLKVAVTFVILAVIITLLAPSKSGLHHQFFKGKPWTGDLLTAPYDFPVYKSEAIISMERDSVREAMPPIYLLNEDIEAKMLQKWKEKYSEIGSQQLSYQYYAYLQEQLRILYANGLIGTEEQNNLRQTGHLEITLVNDAKEAEVIPITRFLTLKEAYEQILDNLPPILDKKVMADLHITEYLQSNIEYSQSFTEQRLKSEMDKLSLSTGIVQAGERIVDKGEIVDGYTYNVLNSLQQAMERRSGGSKQHFAVSVGTFFMILCILITLWLMLRVIAGGKFEREFQNIILLVVLIVILVTLAQMASLYQWFSIYIVPFAILPILMRTFFDTWTAFVSHLCSTLIAALFVIDPLGFIIMQVIAGIVALSSLRSLTSRWQLIKCTFLVFLSYIISYIGLSLLRNGGITVDAGLVLLYLGINLIFMMFTYLLVYIIERGFGYVSNISLVELSDINTPLLRQLSETAPGTFQHSLQVSILATEAASHVNADVQLIRTGALYHDIGKMKNPTYFTENQGMNNPHATLPFDESARIIIRHVTDGIALAQKHALPDAVIDFIRTHHGRGQAKYFYNSYYNEHPDEAIDVDQFTYPGPNPFSKEMGILMLADAVEASSRSLKEFTEEGLEALVNKIVGNIISEGLLDDTPISFHDVQIIKKVFVNKLKVMYHSRITYPERIPNTTPNKQ